MIQAHNKKVRARQFKENDLVLRRILPNQQDPRGKWVLNWQSPYMVKKAFSDRALILTEIDGNDLPSSMNSNAVKKYYA